MTELAAAIVSSGLSVDPVLCPGEVVGIVSAGLDDGAPGLVPVGGGVLSGAGLEPVGGGVLSGPGLEPVGGGVLSGPGLEPVGAGVLSGAPGLDDGPGVCGGVVSWLEAEDRGEV